MRASLDLKRLHSATFARIKFLRETYLGINAFSRAYQSQQLAFVTIELDNLIISTMRAFMISTLRSARTVTGSKISVSTSIVDEEEISAFALSVLNSVKYQKLNSPARIKRTNEYTIRDPKDLEKVLIACGATNLTALQNALSVNSSIFRDVKVVRHFYAHRGEDTFKKVLRNATNMGILSVRHPDEILRHVATGRPSSIAEEWFIDAELFFDLLMD